MKRNDGSDDEATRMLKLAMILLDGGEVTTRSVMRAFRVSLATAKRDLVKLATVLPIDAEWRDVTANNPGRHLVWRRMAVSPPIA